MSTILDDHYVRQLAHKYAPLRAALFEIEAIADHRAHNDVSAMSKLAKIVELCREAVERDDYLQTSTQVPFRNVLYPGI